jgi:hypothetical protein
MSLSLNSHECLGSWICHSRIQNSHSRSTDVLRASSPSHPFRRENDRVMFTADNRRLPPSPGRLRATIVGICRYLPECRRVVLRLTDALLKVDQHWPAAKDYRLTARACTVAPIPVHFYWRFLQQRESEASPSDKWRTINTDGMHGKLKLTNQRAFINIRRTAVRRGPVDRLTVSCQSVTTLLSSYIYNYYY